MNTDMAALFKKILKFRDDRDWAQYHDPKNLSQAISIEAAELQEIFLWKTVAESRHLPAAKVDQIKEELADVFIFMAYLCAEFNIDLLAEVEKKLEKNARRYPIEKSKGRHTKYTEL
jgi:NTP pyrophosphatase (non-canonical NTP hydrolase)